MERLFITNFDLYSCAGIILALFSFLFISITYARKKIPTFDDFVGEQINKNGFRLSDNQKRWLVIILGLLALAAYTYCTLCPKPMYEKAQHKANLFHAFSSFSLRTFPYFIYGCLFYGIIQRYFGSGRLRLPQSMLGGGLLAAVIPMCSCAAVPFSYSMMASEKIRLRVVIAFMMVVSVLNPFVLVFAHGILGLEYILWRIISIFAIALVSALIIERLAGERKMEKGKLVCYTCKGCSPPVREKAHSSSILLASYNLLIFLLYYMLIGIAIGAIFFTFLPPAVVGRYLSSNFLGLLIATTIALPVLICSGEDILILSPLMEMGLPLGHAIAFTITGNAICISAIAILIPLFGRRATVSIVAAFWLGSFIAGFLINLSLPYIHQLITTFGLA